MMRLEVLDSKDKVVSVYPLGSQGEVLTLLGKSPGAHVHLAGEGVGALHVAIKAGADPVVMDLGGPTRLRVDGKEAIEFQIKSTSNSALLEIGSRRVRLTRLAPHLREVRQTKWQPLAGDKDAKASIVRARLYVRGQIEEVLNRNGDIWISERYALAKNTRFAWLKGKSAFAQLPEEWIALGGRIQAGAESILKLEDWSKPVQLDAGVVYRVFAGRYALELLLSPEGLVIGPAPRDFFPRELRRPFAISFGAVLIVFALWMVLFGTPATKVEEPYTVYARIQNIPVEKLPEPEQTAPSDLPQAGGGAGAESKEMTAPNAANPAQSAPSRLAASLTGGLKNLVGNMISRTHANSAVISENGVGQAAASGAPGPQVGKLEAVNQGTGSIAGATKLGKLAIAGSGAGFSGGSGVGLGAGLSSGIGNGVGNGIGRGGFRLVEEESIVDGGLDKSVIAAVIQNNLSQIKYCYERQLVAEPDLFGKVVATWQINPAGVVEGAAVKQTTLNSTPVEQCMLSKISGWRFPQPKNGSRVTVSYPFLFKSTK